MKADAGSWGVGGTTAARDAARGAVCALLVLLACFAITVAVQLIDLPAPPSDVLLILAYLAAFLLITAPAIVFCIVRRFGARELGLVGPRSLASNAVGIAVLLAVVLAGPPLLDMLLSGRHAVASVVTVRTLAVFAMAAAAEEYLFRGFLQPRLVAWLGPGRGIALAAASFSLFHLPKLILAGAAAPYLVVMCVLLATAGAVYGVAAYLFKDIYASAWLHLAANILVGML